MKIIKLVKTKIYYLVINSIFFINSIIPFISVKVINSNNVEDISISFAFRYLLNKFIPCDISKKKYQVHLKTFDKIFILNTSLSDLIYKHNLICELSEKLNPPRSLFIKYNILINGQDLSIDQKNFYKKYADGTKVIDMLKFNGIRLENLKVLKNTQEFKIWTVNNVEELEIGDIYPYL